MKMCCQHFIMAASQGVEDFEADVKRGEELKAIAVAQAALKQCLVCGLEVDLIVVRKMIVYVFHVPSFFLQTK